MNQGTHHEGGNAFANVSCIRTITVGSGVTPDLLTSSVKSARGLFNELNYRQWGITPRPEIDPSFHSVSIEWQVQKRLQGVCRRRGATAVPCIARRATQGSRPQRIQPYDLARLGMTLLVRRGRTSRAPTSIHLKQYLFRSVLVRPSSQQSMVQAECHSHQGVAKIQACNRG